MSESVERLVNVLSIDIILMISLDKPKSREALLELVLRHMSIAMLRLNDGTCDSFMLYSVF